MEANLRACRQRQPAGETIGRYQTVARLLTAKSSAQPEDGTDWVRQLVEDLRVPRLCTYGITAESVDELVEKSAKASSMKANPIALTREELAGILTKAT
jgi:alcohol dehydrogenase class IV